MLEVHRVLRMRKRRRQFTASNVAAFVVSIPGAMWMSATVSTLVWTASTGAGSVAYGLAVQPIRSKRKGADHRMCFNCSIPMLRTRVALLADWSVFQAGKSRSMPERRRAKRRTALPAVSPGVNLRPARTARTRASVRS